MGQGFQAVDSYLELSSSGDPVAASELHQVPHHEAGAAGQGLAVHVLVQRAEVGACALLALRRCRIQGLACHCQQFANGLQQVSCGECQNESACHFKPNYS